MKIVEKFTDLEKANGYVTEANKAMESHAVEKKDLSDKIAEHDKVVLGLTGERDNALNEVGTLSKKLDLQEKHGADGTIVSISGKDYKLSGNRFITKNGEKNAEEISQDKEALKHLLKIGSGVLTLID